MKSFGQHIKENTPADIFADVIDKMIGQAGYKGHEIVGDEITFSFDSTGNADVAYASLDADEIDHMDVPDMEAGADLDNGLDDDDDDYIDMDDTYSSELPESVSEYVSISEAKIIVKVNSKGKKRRRIKCKPGFKLNSKGTSCVPIAGKDKAKKKLSTRKAVRTKKAQGASAAKKRVRKTAKAMRKRKAFGL